MCNNDNNIMLYLSSTVMPLAATEALAEQVGRIVSRKR